MSVNNKHMATILLGAAAAFGAYKYSKMSDEEKEKMANSVKDKFHSLKDEAEKAGDTAKDYFGNLKTKATEMFKEHFPGAEKHFEDFFNKGSKEETPGITPTTATTTTPGAN